MRILRLLPLLFVSVSFFCLIDTAKTSSTILNKNVVSGHLCLVPNFRRNALRCPPQVLTIGLSQIAFFFLHWDMFFVFLVSSKLLYKRMVDFIKKLDYIYWGDHMISSMNPFVWFITFTDLHMWNHPSISGIKPISLWWITFLECS